ncbi:TolC family protein [bacterium]|nr:TolC family protein [bacterium]
MKKIITALLLTLFFVSQPAAMASTVLGKVKADDLKSIKYAPNASTIKYAFVFDGPSDKNAAVLGHFKNAITKLTAPDYKPVFDSKNVYVGDWTKAGAKAASDKALASNANMVVSLGYLSTKYLNNTNNKKKMVVTIDQYGLRDFGDDFFNPVQQSIKGIKTFDKFFDFDKEVAVLINENFYKTKSADAWKKVSAEKLAGMNAVAVPVSQAKVASVISDISAGKYSAVVFTPMFNLTTEQRKQVIDAVNAQHLPSFSTLGKEDVELGVLLGTSALDVDRKLAEATSVNIRGVLAGHKTKPQQVQFYEDQVFHINKDTADIIGWQVPLRVAVQAEMISSKKPQTFTLTSVFNDIRNDNLDIKQKHALVKAARRSAVSAVLRYLPTISFTVGYQQYNEDYADSAKLSIPEKTGVFKMGLDQVIYSPALVTNILLKKKQLNFAKEEAFLTEQEMGLQTAFLYIETLMLENMIKVQNEYVKESRENLAIARVREQMGKCGKEEALRWAAELSTREQNLIEMRAALSNLKIAINKVLHKDQKTMFNLEPLATSNPAFYTSELHIVDYVTYPESLEKFTQMLIEEAYRVSPELAKLKLAMKMKGLERGMYYQKFVLPDAVLSLEYTSLFDREFANPIPALPVNTALGYVPLNKILNTPDATNFRLGIFAQWKPIEGGTKIAEIARVNAEREQLKYLDMEVRTEIERHVRDVINKAVSAYFSIEKNYKASFASGENYKAVKARYLKGQAPIAQLIDAQNIYFESKVKAINSQYVFFKELVWVQRGICAIDWNVASEESKAFIQRIKDEITPHADFPLL